MVVSEREVEYITNKYRVGLCTLRARKTGGSKIIAKEVARNICKITINGGGGGMVFGTLDNLENLSNNLSSASLILSDHLTDYNTKLKLIV